MKKTLVSALTTALVVGAASTTLAAANPVSYTHLHCIFAMQWLFCYKVLFCDEDYSFA